MVNNQEEELELADYWKIIWKRKWIIILSLVVVTASALVFSYLQTPIYEASTTLYIKKKGATSGGIDIFGGAGGFSTQTELNTQIEILKSRTLAEEVVKKLNLDKLQKNKKSSSGIVAGLLKKVFPESLNKATTSSTSEKEDENRKFYATAEGLRGKISAEPIKDTRLIKLTVPSDEPELAEKIANTLANIFIQRDVISRRRESSAALTFLSEQTRKVGEELRESEEELKEYKEREGFGGLSEKAELMVRRLSETEGQYENLRISRGEVSTRLKEIRDQLKNVSKTQISSTYISDNPIVQMLRSRLTNLEIKYAQLSREFSAEDPQTIYIKTQIEETRKQLQHQVGTVVSGKTESINPLYAQLYSKIINYETEINTLKAKEDALGSLRAEYEKEVNKLPEQELRLARLERNKQVNASLYTMLLQAKNKAEIESVSEIGTIEVIDPALKPTTPVKPKKKRNTLLGLVSGLVIGCAFAFVLEYADKTIKTEDEAKHLLNLPVLGVIPQPGAQGSYGYRYSYGGGERKERKKIKAMTSLEKKAPLELITSKLPWSSISEAYRSLRTNLGFVDLDQKLTAIVVTSSVPQEGKTSVVANLGITLSAAKEKVLLVDADLRTPGLHKVFSFNETPGLTDVLTTNKSCKDIIHSVDKVENLYLLTSGSLPPNPSELLTSQKMKNLISELREEYDRVLFDLPPVLGISDASILSSNTDGVLFVLGANEVDREAVQRAKESLEKVKARILGLVLNKVKFERHGYGSYYYYHYPQEGKGNRK